MCEVSHRTVRTFRLARSSRRIIRYYKNPDWRRDPRSIRGFGRRAFRPSPGSHARGGSCSLWTIRLSALPGPVLRSTLARRFAGGHRGNDCLGAPNAKADFATDGGNAALVFETLWRDDRCFDPRRTPSAWQSGRRSARGALQLLDHGGFPVPGNHRPQAGAGDGPTPADAYRTA